MTKCEVLNEAEVTSVNGKRKRKWETQGFCKWYLAGGFLKRVDVRRRVKPKSVYAGVNLVQVTHD